MPVNVGQMLQALGLLAKRSGKRWLALCPAGCEKDGRPSWSIVDDPGGHKSGAHHCFSCGFGGGPWELAAQVLGISLEEAGAWVRSRAASSPPASLPRVVVRQQARRKFELPAFVEIPSLDGSIWFQPALDYLLGRGVEPWQIERWHVGFATRGRCAKRVVFPVVTAGRLVSYVARDFGGASPTRYLTPRESDGALPHAAIFGEPAVDPALGYVVVTEGVLKVLALERLGVRNAAAVLGAANLSATKIRYLAGFGDILVATDPDPAGDLAHERLSRSLSRYARVERVRLSAAPDDLALSGVGQREIRDAFALGC